MQTLPRADPPVVRLSARACGELDPTAVLVFDWVRLPMCCAVAGEVSLRRTTTREVDRSAAFVPLPVENRGVRVVAHRHAYPLLAGRRIEVDCRRRFGMRSFSSTLPADLGLRSSFGRTRPVDSPPDAAPVVSGPRT